MPVPSSIAGPVAGVVLLAGVVGFAVGLPEATGDEPAAETGTAGQTDERPVADLLPEAMLDGAVRRIADINPDFTAMADEVEAYGTEKLSEVFGSDVVVGRYATENLQVEVSVTIYDGESGLFLQTGPPYPPEMAQNQAVVSDLVRVGETPCAAQWQAEALQQDAPPFQVQCQRTSEGRTFNVYAVGGLSAEQTVEILDDVVSQAAE